MARAKERRLRTYPHRWGEGKVHRLLWSAENRVWYPACSTPHAAGGFGGYGFHGERIEDDAEVTCKVCGSPG